MPLRWLLPKHQKPYRLHEPEVMSESEDGMDCEVTVEDEPVDVEINTAEKQEFEPTHRADDVADAARAGNARNITPAIENNSPTPHQVNMEVHTEEAITTGVSSAEGSNITPVDMMREVNRVRLPIASENDEDDYIFTAATSSSGISRSTTLYVIYEVEQENRVSRSEDEQWSEEDDADDISATVASSDSEAHQTALHDMWNRELSSIQRSVLALTAGQSTITTVSPYRKDLRDEIREQQLATEEGENKPIFKFSKQLLIWMDHDKTHLEIDLFRPKDQGHIYPTHVLSPLCLYRNLHSLKIVGMMRSYQPYIWLVVWMNRYLSELTLETSSEGEAMDGTEILKAREYAKGKPTMSEVARGNTRAKIFHKFPMTKLSLSNFVLDGSFFGWLNSTRLLEIEIRRCKVPNDFLEDDGIPGLTNAKVTIIP